MAIARTRIKGSYEPYMQTLGRNYVRDWSAWPLVRWVPGGYEYWNYWGPTSVPEDISFCCDELHKLSGGISPRYKGKKPRKKKVAYREGGPLFLKRIKQERERVNLGFITQCYHAYDGHFMIGVNSSDLVNTYNQYAESAGAYGASAWSKFRPVKSALNMGQFLAEMRDIGIPGMMQKCQQLKDAGGAYLSYRFGWAPFIGDLLKLIKFQKKIEKRIRFIRKNNNRWIKRRGTVRFDVSTNVTTGSGHIIVPILPSYFYPNYQANQTYDIMVQQTDKIWFEGMMKYWIPGLNIDSAESIWSSPLLRKLYGMELTPSLVWELIPWSWMVDWFADVGNCISNFIDNSYDQLVAKYAYVMRTRVHSITYRQEQTYVMCDGSCLTINPKLKAEVSCKERATASPFGFGLETGDLSPSQLAILAALGLTALPI